MTKFYQQQSYNKSNLKELFNIMPVCTNPNMVICLLILLVQSLKHEMQVNAAGSFHFVHIIKNCFVTSFKFQANTFSNCGR